MQNPLQIRPASTIRKQEERKVFVGMISKTMGEIEVSHDYETTFRLLCKQGLCLLSLTKGEEGD